jgi:two-component system, chemotaxis family, protein-glutamate methylesterase/glutaminase
MKRVLIVDDSSFMRKSLTHLLASDAEIEVVGTATDGADALRQVRRLRPNVVLLDIEMSGMDGLAALTYIMEDCPTPVLILTGLDPSDGTLAIKCLDHGAVDLISKPSGVISYDIDKLRSEIVEKVKAAADVPVGELIPRRDREPLRTAATRLPTRDRVVVLGASTGGPRALAMILRALPPTLTASLLIVQHMSPVFIPSFAERLKWESVLDIRVARADDPLTPGCVMVAPGGCHTVIERTGDERRIRLSNKTSPHALCPAVDFAMESAAEAYGEGAVGVLLTGIGTDGAQGMQAIKAHGGRTIAEDPSTCVVFGMPKAAIERGCVDHIVPLPLVAETILQLI